MNELIELLNEHLKTFDTETNKTNKVYAFENATKSFIAKNGTSYRQEGVISKRFKFIKRLVENNKIDTEKIENSEYYFIDRRYYYERKKFGIERKEDLEEILLMLLAISDSPVNDLISYLR